MTSLTDSGRTIDLNADLGEGFGQWTLGDDNAMFGLVSSANVACGFHAGDPLTMLHCCRLGIENSVSIGAHVAYRDLAGFGRREMEIAPAELHGDVIYQLAALAGIAASTGTAVTYVKPHGALYNRIARDPQQAAAVAAAVHDFDPALPLMGLPNSAIEAAADDAGLRFVREAFPDRAYTESGMLVPRSQPGAIITDPATVAAHAVQLANTAGIESLCLHGDTPDAVNLAIATRAALAEAGFSIRAFA